MLEIKKEFRDLLVSMLSGIKGDIASETSIKGMIVTLKELKENEEVVTPEVIQDEVTPN